MHLTKYEHGHFNDSAEGMLLTAVRFRASGEVRFPPPEFLHRGQDLDLLPLGPLGQLYTYTTVHPGKDASYSLAMVDFDPGLRVFGRLLAQEGHAPALGDTVRVVPFTLADGTPDYAFEAVAGVAK
jgi:uncharacterized OB-fold protein